MYVEKKKKSRYICGRLTYITMMYVGKMKVKLKRRAKEFAEVIKLK